MNPGEDVTVEGWTAEQIKELHDRDIQAAKDLAAANLARVEARVDAQERAVATLASSRQEQRVDSRDNRGAAIALAAVLISVVLIYTNRMHRSQPINVYPTITAPAPK